MSIMTTFLIMTLIMRGHSGSVYVASRAYVEHYRPPRRPDAVRLAAARLDAHMGCGHEDDGNSGGGRNGGALNRYDPS